MKNKILAYTFLLAYIVIIGICFSINTQSGFFAMAAACCAAGYIYWITKC